MVSIGNCGMCHCLKMPTTPLSSETSLMLCKLFVSFSKGHGPQCQKVLQLNYI